MSPFFIKKMDGLSLLFFLLIISMLKSALGIFIDGVGRRIGTRQFRRKFGKIVTVLKVKVCIFELF